MTTSNKSLTFVEIDVNYCQNTYGQSPCTAEVGTTGSAKCYNTRNLSADCQDPENFTAGTLTYRFAVPTDYLPSSIDCIANVRDVSLTTPRIKPGESLGERMSATVKFRNHPHGDAGIDKYWGERNYIPYEQGTFWGKFRARNPYIKGRPLRIIQGYEGQTLAEMKTYNLVVDNFSGPDPSGNFTIKAVDIFRFLDNDKAQAPAVSNGYLSSAINDTATSVTLEPIGIGDDEYPASGIASIGKETVTFTRSGDTFTIVRGQHGTTADSHDAEDVFQIALQYTGQNVDDIIYDLITNYTDLDASYIDLTEWAAEIDNYIDLLYQAIIVRPTGVRDLINELIVEAGLVMWPDVETNKVKMRALRPVVSSAIAINDDQILEGTFKPTDQQDKRVSSVWSYYNQRDLHEKKDEENNYLSVLATVGQNSDQYTSSSIRKIFSRWMPQFGRSFAQRLNAMILSRYETPPRQFKFDLPRSFQIAMGQGANLQSAVLEEADGSGSTVPVQITSIGYLFDRKQIVAEEMLFTEQEGLGDRIIVIDSDAYNLNLRSIYDSLYSSLAEDEEITFIIEAGVIVGSLSNAQPALEIGSWPAGVTLNGINRGRVQGRGGDGGNAPQDGEDGGLALLVERDINLDNTSGEIWGGGGGGASAYGGNNPVALGGGGGAGKQPGAAGGGQSTGFPGTTEEGGSGQYFSETLYSGDGGGPGEDGDPSSSGQSGGTAGNAIDGDSHITFNGEGSILGGRIN